VRRPPSEPAPDGVAGSTGRRLPWRSLAAGGVVLLVVGWVGWQWQASLVPAGYSVMDMGVVDTGGGAAHGGHAQHARTVSAESAEDIGVDALRGPVDGPADAVFELVARRGSSRLATGEEVGRYTLNGSTPGPELRVRQGDLVEVTLVNADVADGVTLHWHGVDVPNAEDGVAGVTQDAVPAGERHVYRFVAEDAGTYWYHSHQVSHEQVRRGLWGVLVVEPSETAGAEAADLVAAVHTYDGVRTVSGRTGVWTVPAAPGSTHRVRLVNTDNGPLRAWVVGAPFRVLAVDGFDLHGATPVREQLLVLGAGARLDLEVDLPPDGEPVRVDLGAGTAVVLGGATDDPGPLGKDAPSKRLDLLTYGSPAALPFDVDAADRRFEYRIGRRLGFLDGRPGFWWTVNGRLFPDVPMYVVREGDVVRMTISNGSGDVHPMHLHGHHAVVLSRNGVPASGSPWWVDTLNVEDGETYEIAFLADNPGIWMDHCHNLPHAVEGLVAHLMYEGVTTPYRVGPVEDGPHNHPE
jgi:FtsP/CotA-like multicopper oxidase with cupredoxin domain